MQQTQLGTVLAPLQLPILARLHLPAQIIDHLQQRSLQRVIPRLRVVGRSRHFQRRKHAEPWLDFTLVFQRDSRGEYRCQTLQLPHLPLDQPSPNFARIQAAVRQIDFQLISITHIIQFHIR